MTDLPAPRVVGTFLKVIPHGFADSIVSDESLQVLYIRKSGLFLFIGYWLGYELTAAAGHWRRDGDSVTLEGVGAFLLRDTLPYPMGLRRFERQFTLQREEFTPVLVADDELEGWSLLSWRGPFTYVGQHLFLEIRDERMPKSWSEVDGWIKNFSGAA